MVWVGRGPNPSRRAIPVTDPQADSGVTSRGPLRYETKASPPTAIASSRPMAMNGPGPGRPPADGAAGRARDVLDVPRRIWQLRPERRSRRDRRDRDVLARRQDRGADVEAAAGRIEHVPAVAREPDLDPGVRPGVLDGLDAFDAACAGQEALDEPGRDVERAHEDRHRRRVVLAEALLERREALDDAEVAALDARDIR